MNEQFRARIADVVARILRRAVGSGTIRLADRGNAAPGSQSWTGCVELEGGALRISMSFSSQLATDVAAAMFALPTTGVVFADIEDALGELCSMVSGSLKCLVLPGCTMGLPEVVRGREDPQELEAQLLCELPFAVDGERLYLTIAGDRYAEVAA